MHKELSKKKIMSRVTILLILLVSLPEFPIIGRFIMFSTVFYLGWTFSEEWRRLTEQDSIEEEQNKTSK
jgi:flagellar biosynthesis component FlhA